MARPKDSPELVTFNTTEIPEGFERVRIARTRGPILRFIGKVIAEKIHGSKANNQRWIELRVWETLGGAWVVEKANASDAPGERDFFAAWVIEAAVPIEERPAHVMEALDWSNLARTMAKELGWKFEEFVY
jgi:hypothetical protein